MMSGDSIELDFSENVAGVISEVIESPFGIMLKDISSTETDAENLEMMFIPMSQITRMDFLKQEQTISQKVKKKRGIT